MFGFKRFSIIAAAVIASTLLAGCNSTPTVPVPPPEICAATPPDGNGLCTISCEEGQTRRNVALVYNNDWGAGVMQETEDDGSFQTELEADVGDEIVIQIKYGSKLSSEVALMIPAE